MQALLHYFLRTRGEGHTQLMARSVARELIGSYNKPIAVWTWTMSEANDIARHVRAELETTYESPSTVDGLMSRVKWLSAAGGSPVVGFRAPAFVDNHVVIELASDLDRTRSDLRRARDVIGYQEQKLDDLMLAHHLDALAKQSMRQRIADLREVIDAKEAELAVLRAKLDEEG